MNPNLQNMQQQTSGNPNQPGVPQNVPSKSNQNSTQNTLQIAEIRDGIVIMQDGSFRAVIACQSINFDLMSPEEREAVEYSYQGFLNSLYFPVQIFVRSQKVDMRPYIEKLDKIRSEHDNMLLALLMEDYIGFMSDISMQTNIMDKKFYLVIPFFKSVDTQQAVQASKSFFTNIFGKKEEKVTINEQDLEKGKTELRNRIQAVMAGLQQCGVNSVPLDTQELIELYYDAYNPDTATRQKLHNFKDMDAPVVTKGEGMANQPQLEREMDI
jgi:type IV secretory pathway VirB4 component